MRFVLPGFGPVIKLGFSRDPASRLGFQLKATRDLDATLLRTVPMASGHRALCVERQLHGRLRRSYPDAVVPHAAWRGLIRVKSEIYDAVLLPVIAAMLDEVAAGAG